MTTFAFVCLLASVPRFFHGTAFAEVCVDEGHRRCIDGSHVWRIMDNGGRGARARSVSATTAPRVVTRPDNLGKEPSARILGGCHEEALRVFVFIQVVERFRLG